MAAGASSPEAVLVEERFLDLVRELLAELGKHQAVGKVTPGASLERDLGLASLDLVELLVRCEIRFEVRLPDSIAEEAETAAGWVRAIMAGGETAEGVGAYHIPAPPPEAPPAPETARTLAEVLRRHADAAPDRVHAHILDGDAGVAVTYGGLLENASRVAAGLAAQGVRPNDAVAIMLPTGADFLEAFFGVMLAGGVAVPIYPPSNPDAIEEYVRRQIRILSDAEIRFLISFDRVRAVAQLIRFQLPSLLGVATVEALSADGAGGWSGPPEPSGTALIQYTSGSTGDPKGVILSHANVLANVRAIGEAVRVTASDAVVSWLPLCSDMGMIGAWLFALYHATPITLLSPLEFLENPERWLWAIHNSRGTLSPAPNFAYDLCTRKIPAWTLEGLDLSAWRGAVNAGEAVLPETIQRFTRRFTPFGFREEAFLVCYGLAESSVALCFPEGGRAPRLDAIARQPFEAEGRAEPCAGPGDALRFYSAGRPLRGHEVRVVDERGAPLPERREGRLLFRGPSMTAGYHGSAAPAAADGWMDTGDLGYMAGGEVVFTRRNKDTIIKSGRSIGAEEVETAVSGVPGVEPGGAAAFGVVDRETGTEDLVIVCESRATRAEDERRIRAGVRRAVEDLIGMAPDRVELAPPGTLPRTANGKMRRNELRAGRRAAARPPWLQMALLWGDNLRPLAGYGVANGWRGVRRAAVFSSTAGAAALLRLAHGESLVRGLSRGLLRIDGREYSLEGGPIAAPPAVFAVNRHARLDALLLAAALPGEVRFAEAPFPLAPVAVAALDGEPWPPGGTLRQRIRRELENGRSVVVFAEGRNRFRLDAFYAAIESGAAVQPIAIRNGPAGRVRIVPGEPLAPDPPAGPAALRDRVRAALAELCQ